MLSYRNQKSRTKLRDLKNKVHAKRAVILCNGPSILESELHLLHDTFTIGLNKVNLLYDKTDLRPNLIVCVNPLMIEANLDFLNNTETILILDRIARKKGVKARDNVIFINCIDHPFFSTSCEFGIFQGFTVTYVALQLALYLGIKDVTLVGCDHNYGSHGLPNEIVKYTPTSENTHFDPGYLENGELWQIPDLAASEYYYSLANLAYQKLGGLVTNSSSKTKLKVFKRVSLRDFIEKSSRF